MSDRERVGSAFALLADGLAGPVDRVMRKAFDGREDWNELWAQAESLPGRRALRYSKNDPQILLKAMTHPRYGTKFNSILQWHQRAWAKELIDVRNRWAHNEPMPHEDAVRALDTIQRLLEAVGASRQAGQVRQFRSAVERVLVGQPTQVGAGYQPRGFDAELERLWNDGGDRRVWLRGGPGLGKSYSARRVMQEAIADQNPDREVLLIWVDSADGVAVRGALSSAADRLRQHGFAVPVHSKTPADDKAKALLGVLATSTWRWLIVLDNADVASLVTDGLIPPGGNPNGRVLLTTLSQDHRIPSNGRVVEATLFTSEESDAYLRGVLHTRNDLGPQSIASGAQAKALAEAVAHHPLALSIATSTITANAMTVQEWLDEFATTEVIDAAADEPDRGGYPHLTGATWQIALEKASQGLPHGVVERAAIVAALQDPDGHPTWLWELDDVVRWVAGDATLARSHGVPVAVQRLMDAGVLELRGGPWKQGKVAIHQLAARAVRELPDSGTLAQIAGILGEQWLIEVSSNPRGANSESLRANLTPIAALAELPTATRRTATVLCGYGEPAPSIGLALVNQSRLADLLESYGELGGNSVRIRVAEQLKEVACAWTELGRSEESQAALRRAAGHLRQVVESGSLRDAELASCLSSLGDIEAQLGHPDQAQANRKRAVPLLERLVDSTPDTGAAVGYLKELVAVLDQLEEGDRKGRAVVRAEELLEHVPDELPVPSQWEEVWRLGKTWGLLADLMLQAQRPESAKICLTRETGVYEAHPEAWSKTERHWVDAVQQLAVLHASTGGLSDAERLLTRLTDASWPTWASPDEDEDEETGQNLFDYERREALVLLASVRTRLGHRDDGDEALARAAVQYPATAGASDGWTQGVSELPEESGHHSTRILLQVNLHMAAVDAVKGGRWGEAEALAGHFLEIAERDANTEQADEAVEQELASAHAQMGVALLGQRRWDGAASHLAKALTIRQLLADLDPESVDRQRAVADLRGFMTTCLHLDGRIREAEESMAKCVGANRRVVEVAPDDPRGMADLAQALIRLAWMKADDLGELDEAVECVEEAIGIRSSLAEEVPDDPDARIAIAEAFKSLGALLLLREQQESAIQPLRQSIAAYAEALAAGEDQRAVRGLGQSNVLLSRALAGIGSHQEALDHGVEAVKTLGAMADGAPDDPEIQEEAASALLILAGAQSRSGQHEESLDCLVRAANILQLLHDLNPQGRPEQLIAALRTFEESLRDLGRTDEADQAAARARDLEDRFPRDEDSQ